jgi:hypothetical protein
MNATAAKERVSSGLARCIYRTHMPSKVTINRDPTGDGPRFMVGRVAIYRDCSFSLKLQEIV